MKRLLTLVLIAGGIAVPSSALADSGCTYCNNGLPKQSGRVHGITATRGSTTPTTGATPAGGSSTPSGSTASSTPTANTTEATSGDTLPFTGIDVGFLAAGGAALLGTGLVVRRLARD